MSPTDWYSQLFESVEGCFPLPLNHGLWPIDGSDDLPQLHLYHQALARLPCDGVCLEVGAGPVGLGRFVRGADCDRPYLVELDLIGWRGSDSSQRVRGDGAEMPFRSEAFDNGYLIEAWHALGDRGASLAEIRRVLRPSARAYICDGFRMDEPFASPNTRLWLEAGFRLLAEADLSRQVEESLTKATPRYLEAFSRLVAGSAIAQELTDLLREALARARFGYSEGVFVFKEFLLQRS